ncbi:hypothetical protein CALCODRAFT_533732 [Calocera cornea HHB12733]|uniref:Uncharacterized protein n=1 Tax=Calocera cornea HHB12733 TaxID=1353952 RepID=A0A165K3P6_9BASI|nr:hypothetical protein CALCODRAFT_533732 [Calocera cornea HHB12733]
MSDLYVYIAPQLIGRTPPLTHAAARLRSQPNLPVAVPAAATTQRYPYCHLPYIGIADGPHSLVGHRWRLLQSYILNQAHILDAVHEEERLRLELDWLRSIAHENEADIHQRIFERDRFLNTLLAESALGLVQVRQHVTTVHNHRSLRIDFDYRQQIPPFNAMTSAILQILLQDLDSNIDTVRLLVDRHQHRDIFDLMLEDWRAIVEVEWDDVQQKPPSVQAAIRRYIQLNHDIFALQHSIDLTNYNIELLEVEIELWNDPASGLMTPCGGWHPPPIPSSQGSEADNQH